MSPVAPSRSPWRTRGTAAPFMLDFEVGGGRLFSAVGRLSMRPKVNYFTVVF